MNKEIFESVDQVLEDQKIKKSQVLKSFLTGYRVGVRYLESLEKRCL